MYKRFVDCDRWEDPWYRKLSVKYKCLWEYITNKCDNAGVWKEDMELAQFQIGEAFNKEEALGFFNDGKERIKVLSRGRWWVTNFIKFQYGELGQNSNPHRQVRSLLKDHGITSIQGYMKPSGRLQDQDQEKDQEKEKEGVQGEKEVWLSRAFEDFWKLYPNRNGRKLLKRDALKQFARLDEAAIPSLMQAVRNYAESGQIPKDPPRFLKEDYWKEWLEPVRFPERQKVVEKPTRENGNFPRESSSPSPEFLALRDKLAKEKAVK